MRSWIPMVVVVAALACRSEDPCAQPDLLGDGVDQNCDGLDGIDQDGDGHAALASGGDDCDDGDPSVHPGAVDDCDDLDDDCNGAPDDGPDATDWFADGDADGFGRDGEVLRRCAAPAGYTDRGGDCDDARAVVNPARAEACNGWDDDCDGVTDGPGADGFATWHADRDGDGFGDPDETTEGCAATVPSVLDDTDCDDGRDDVHPGATETCDDEDDDCDGTPDDDAVDAAPWTLDVDGDGFGDDATATRSCDPVAGRVSVGGDCADTDAARSPAAAETCAAGDEDCDGAEGDADPDVAAPTWFRDLDADGHGDPRAPVRGCAQPPDTVATPDDCDDAASSVNPGAVEVPGDGLDQDCDGIDPPDFDRDGWSTPDDCDDGDPNVSPTASDVAGDGLDQNCDAVDGTDVDQDGWASVESGGDDCLDLDADAFPGARERLGNGQNDACTGEDDAIVLADTPGALRGDGEGRFLGYAVTGGDYDGDGVGELVIGAPRSRSAYGTVYRFAGAWPEGAVPTDADAVITAGVPSSNYAYGAWLDTLPDLDGDGLVELAVGNPDYSSGYGRITLWLDPPVGAVGEMDADLVVESNWWVRRVVAGEVTGDGAIDLVVPSETTSDVAVVPGPFAPPARLHATNDGIAGFSDPSVSNPAPTKVAVGDLNGDGVDDVVVGHPQWSSVTDAYVGRVAVFFGPVAGRYSIPADADAVIYGDAANGSFGRELTVADLDGDDAAELIVSSTAWAPPSYTGAVWVFSGPFAGVSTAADADARITGDGLSSSFGQGAVAPGDLDGDGAADLVIGGGLGRIHVVRGPFAGDHVLTDVPQGWVEGGVGTGPVGTWAVVPDADGDGLPDLLVGVPNDRAWLYDAGAAWFLSAPW